MELDGNLTTADALRVLSAANIAEAMSESLFFGRHLLRHLGLHGRQRWEHHSYRE
jgi:hypothetical protein